MLTSQESFKRRIRARMRTTGERYGAARRALLERADRHGGGRRWVAEPDLDDAAVREKTGRGWNEWVDLIDEGPAAGAGHTAIATWLRETHGVDGWWAQGVTVGYERITGLRLPGQQSDGTFSVSRSRTVSLDADAFRELLLDDAARADLLPGLDTTLRSRPTAKALRLAATREGEPAGTLQFALDPASGGRIRLTVTHDKLPDPTAAGAWKAHWASWLDALAATVSDESAVGPTPT